jgi:hypothetical protein
MVCQNLFHFLENFLFCSEFLRWIFPEEFVKKYNPNHLAAIAAEILAEIAADSATKCRLMYGISAPKKAKSVCIL